MKHFDTRSVHFSEKNTEGEVPKTLPIYQTSAFAFKDLDDLESYYSGQKAYLYSRIDNPNTHELGMATAQLEGAPVGIATSSGISAILVGILSAVKAGDHIVACEDLYGGTYQLVSKELKDFGIEVTYVSFEDEQAIKHAIKDNTKLLFSETITNPLLRVENIERLVDIAKAHQLVTMLDNTFATPYLIQPYIKGADLVVHSATKYIGGHSDLTAGVLVGSEALMAKAKDKMVNFGTNLGPFDGWLACRGLKTLSVRMARQVKNASDLAQSLQNHPGVKKVYYPENVSEQGNGAIVTIELSGDRSNVEHFFKSLSWVKIVATLAGVETSVSHPLSSSHRALPPELCQKLGINERVVRISVGIEDPQDIISCFNDALSK